MDFWSIICWAFVMVMGALLGLLVEDLINRIDKRRRFKAAADERYFEIETAEGRRMLKVNGRCEIDKAEGRRTFRVKGCFQLLGYRLSLTEQGSAELEIKLGIEESDFRAAWRTEEKVDITALLMGTDREGDTEEALIEPDDDADILTAFMGSGPTLDE